jgi:replicative DNA helicase
MTQSGKPDSNLEAALGFVRDMSGWVFPSRWDPKRKTHRPLTAWSKENGSTNDPAQVEAWARAWPGCYFCVNLGESGLSVLDVDKKHGIDGMETLQGHAFSGRTCPKTYTVKTPSGGFHFFYDGAGLKNTVGEKGLGQGLDTRGAGGMVPVPGTVIPEKGAYKIVDDTLPVPLPAWIPEIAGAARQKDPGQSSVPVAPPDHPSSLHLAREYLIHDAPEAIQGHGGDAATYEVACHLVRDLGLTVDTAHDLLLNHWNDAKASPPWSFEELRTKLENAKRYGQNPPGAKSPAAAFPPVPDTLDAPGAAGTPQAGKAGESAKKWPFDPLGWEQTLVRPRLFEEPPKPETMLFCNGRPLINKGTVAILAAKGGTGKSYFLLSLAKALAEGGVFGPFEAKKPRPVLYLGGEDSQEELDWRLWEICGKSAPEKMGAVSVSGKTGQLMKLEGQNPVPSVWHDWLRETLRLHPCLEFLIMDPLSRFYGLQENANEHATAFIAMLEGICAEFGLTVMFSHHTPKGDKKDGPSQNLVRGASGFVDGARCVLGMWEMDSSSAKLHNIEDSRNCVLVDTLKSNNTPRFPNWVAFRRTDNGVLEHVPLAYNRMKTLAEVLIPCLEESGKEFSKNELINGGKKPEDTKKIAEALKAKVEDFARSRDMPRVIEYCIERGRLEEIKGGDSRNKRKVLKPKGADAVDWGQNAGEWGESPTIQ